MTEREQSIQQRIRIAHSRGPVRLWRNNVGCAWTGKTIRITPKNYAIIARQLSPGDIVIKMPRIINFGLCSGSADLVGVKRLRSGLGRFVALEIKRPGVRVDKHQAQWLAFMRNMGAIAEVVHSEEEADALLRAPPD